MDLQQKPAITRTASALYEQANILHVKVIHNGYCGGDAGHGGFVKIELENQGCTAMKLNGKDTDKISMEFLGDTERMTLLAGLKMIVKELEENEKV